MRPAAPMDRFSDAYDPGLALDRPTRREAEADVAEERRYTPVSGPLVAAPVCPEVESGRTLPGGLSVENRLKEAYIPLTSTVQCSTSWWSTGEPPEPATAGAYPAPRPPSLPGAMALAIPVTAGGYLRHGVGG